MRWKRDLATGEVGSALRAAFRAASEPRAVAEPLDWLVNDFPSVWRFADDVVVYDWQ